MSKQKNWKNIITKDFLIKEYIDNKKSTHKLSNELGCSKNTIIQKLIKFDIKRRNKEQSIKHGDIVKCDSCKKEFYIPLNKILKNKNTIVVNYVLIMD